MILPLLMAAGAAWLLGRRRKAVPAGTAEPVEGQPEPVDLPPVLPPASTPVVTLRPLRIGLNMLTATVECEIGVASDVAMQDVRIGLHLLAAAMDEGRTIADLHDAPPGRLVTLAFALAAGAARTVRGVGVLAREAAGGLEAAGRPLFVPLVVVRIDWRDGRGEHRLTHAFAVGVERVDSPKLAPIWLDQPARSYDQVAARAHGDPLRQSVALN